MIVLLFILISIIGLLVLFSLSPGDGNDDFDTYF
ncbi:hypothetical protein VIK251_00207 [Klebsiella phage vB_KpnM_VIK251]|jgi:hypothetical protein|nr:hypothetical protein VIK251_00207 [Klebsiella phage vB_KpnM_VIK251]